MSESGFYNDRHYTEYVENVKELKRSGDLDKAEKLLLSLVNATEAESRAQGWDVAPWYYEQLAIVYRKRGDHQSEVEILERFSTRQHAPGDKPSKLMERLGKLKDRLDSRSGS